LIEQVNIWFPDNSAHKKLDSELSGVDMPFSNLITPQIAGYQENL